MSEDDKKKKSTTSWLIKFESTELTRFPDAAAALSVFIPAVQTCYTIWNPLETGMDEQTFERHLLRCSSSAVHIYRTQQPQDDVLRNALEEMDIPQVIEIVATLTAAFEKCRSIWKKDDFDDKEVTDMGLNLIHLIGLKMYRQGQ